MAVSDGSSGTSTVTSVSLGEARVELDFAGLEQAVGAGVDVRQRADDETGREDAAEAGGDQHFGVVGRGEDIERHKLNHAAGRAEGRAEAALIADGARVALERRGEAHLRAADEIDDGGVGMDLGHAADHAAGENHRRADGEAVVAALADHQPLPPGGKITPDDARGLGAVVFKRRQAQQALEAGDVPVERDIFLHFQFVGGVEAGEVAAGLDKLVLGVVAQRPEILQVPRVGDRGVEGRLHFKN